MTINMKQVNNDRRTTLTSDFVVGHEYEVVVRAVGEDGTNEAMEHAARNTIVIEGKQAAPLAPTVLTATGFLESIILSWVNPTDYDFKHMEIWRSNTGSQESTSFDKIAEVSGIIFTDDIGEASITRYYWIRAVNTSGIVSDYYPTGAGVSATTLGVAATDIDDFAITATKMFTNTIILSGDVWTNDTPDGNSVSWNAHTIVYNGASYPITAGNTSAAYIYWVIGNTTYSTSATHPVLGTTGFMIAINTAGVHTLVWNSSANMVIGTAFIANLAVTNAKINDLSASKLTAGTIDASVITVTNLSASNLTVGTLPVARIGATSIEAAKLGTTVISGGKIITSLLTASNIQTGTLNAAVVTVDNLTATMVEAGTLTGSTVQTAASGQRTVMQVSDNTLRLINSDDDAVVTIDDSLAGSGRPGMFIGSASGGYLSVSNVVLGGSATSYTEIYEGNIDAVDASTGIVNSFRAWRTGASGTGSNFLGLNPSGFTGNLFRGLVNSVAVFNVDYRGYCDAVKYLVNGAAGANFNGAVTNITVVDGLVTAVS